MCKEGMCGGVCKKSFCTSAMVGKALLIVGGINWGLVGLGMLTGSGDWNAVHFLLGALLELEAVVYLLVGVSALIMICGCKCGKCKNACSSCESCTTKDGVGAGSNM